MIEPNHAAGVKLIFLILTVASAGILFYYVTVAPKNEQKKTLRMIVVVFGDPIASFRKVPPCGTNEHTTF